MLKTYDIRFKIIASFFFIILLTTVFVATINFMASQNLIKTQIQNELDHSASLIIDNIEGKISTASKLADKLSKSDEIINVSEKTGVAMDHFVQFVDLYFNAFYWEKNGKVNHCSYYDFRNIDHYLKENLFEYKNDFPDYARDILKNKQALYTKTFYPKPDHLILAYAVPVFRDKVVSGLMSFGIHINDPKIQNIVERMIPSHNGFVALIDHQGKILAKGGKSPANFKHVDLKKLDTDILRLGQDTFSYRLQKAKQADIYVLVAINNNTALSIIDDLAFSIIIYSFIALILSIILSSRIANSLSQPIKALIDGIQAIDQGVYSTQINTKSSGELNTAINAFNQMAQKLQRNKMIEKIWMNHWEQNDEK
ncbi:MAG: cache and HAMP domain-containing protein [Candidatus Cloacimonetes bacterium]|nr:cache and HAMP domain-containing protein [Candidatus Cloacimonadota bacterium]